MNNYRVVKIGELLKPYRIEHIIDDSKIYKQITISKNYGISIRGDKSGKSIGRKRQFLIDLQEHPNTVLFTRQGVIEGAIGLAPKEADGCVVTENMPMMSVNTDIVKVPYLRKLLISDYLREKICELTLVGSAQKSIHERDFLKIELQIPPLSIQQKIIKKFDTLDREHHGLKDQINHQQSLLKKLRQQILQEAIEGKLSADWRQQNPKTEPASELLKRIQAEKAQLVKTKKIKAPKPLPPISPEEKPFALPDGWEWCQLGDVINLYEAGKSVKCMDRQIEDEEWGVIKTSAITSSTFQESEHKFYQPDTPSDISKAIRNGDLLFCRASGSKGLAGKCSLVSNISKNLLLSDKTLRLTTSENINKRYIYFHNETRHTTAYYSKLNTGKSTSMNNITREQLLSKPIPLPPLAEQKAIVAKVEKLLALCDQLESKINQSQHHANSLMQAVLQEAFTGASI